MEDNQQHRAHMQYQHKTSITNESTMKLAVSATIHCLIGCGIGEVAGMIVAAYFGMSMTDSLLLSIALGFVFGFTLGMVPLVKKGLSVGKSMKIVLVGEGLSIAVMEAFEVLTQVLIPGVMLATLNDGIFWFGMIASLIVGFGAALPVNYYMIKQGVRHQH